MSAALLLLAVSLIETVVDVVGIRRGDRERERNYSTVKRLESKSVLTAPSTEIPGSYTCCRLNHN